jgi:serine/threonine-protein kinase
MGAVMYEMLSGTPPFRGEHIAEVIHAVIERDPPPLGELIVGMPRDLQTICETAMAKLATQRYESADALADDCDRWLRGERIHARPLRAIEKAGIMIGRHRRLLFALALLATAAGGAAAALLIERALNLTP